jgi:hypothetical protein
MKLKLNLLLLALISITISSCEAIGTIFKAGVWTGVIIIFGIILLLLTIFTRKK